MEFTFAADTNEILDCTVSPFREMAAYEALWLNDKASFKRLSELFAKNPSALPSDHVEESAIQELSTRIIDFLKSNLSTIKPNLLINNTFDYPKKLRDAKEPVEILYFSGNLEYINTRGIAIVGSRKPSENGLKRAEKLAKLLVEKDFTIVSGLAEGIDTKAHETALKNGGRTIAVIGTPLTDFYPKQNRDLQLRIAKEHLLISQVPFFRYARQSFHGNRLFFPERNKTMSALTEATIIVEASETSGTLIQAKAALDQGRKLFILNSCFENPNITWPKRYESMGAIRVIDFEDILINLGDVL